MPSGVAHSPAPQPWRLVRDQRSPCAQSLYDAVAMAPLASPRRPVRQPGAPRLAAARASGVSCSPAPRPWCPRVRTGTVRYRPGRLGPRSRPLRDAAGRRGPLVRSTGRGWHVPHGQLLPGLAATGGIGEFVLGAQPPIQPSLTGGVLHKERDGTYPRS
ncbi:hypothetical protein U9M48_007560 [Paspalum notatum var. saurae]|uniref:Uncharacterized protein n=1 Tax=Paspalum notatum var. saurae TaxID=547442 RepID=A0AAQ3PS34_PASNO